LKCPKCKFDQTDGSLECVRCGIIFEKFTERQKILHGKNISLKSPASPPKEETCRVARVISSTKEFLLHVEPRVNPYYFGGRIGFFLVIFFWGWKFILTPMESNYTGMSFLHLVNLPFHEAGHIIFSPLGEFLSVLGGSLTQLLIPFICMLVFILKTRDTFAASISLWWLGESFMDIAPYINDARELNLILLGGVTGRDVPGYHDWEFILSKLGWLQYDHLLANIAYTKGILLMLATFVWGGYLLYKQFKNLDLP
jgi:hypothetical protein